MKETEIVVSQVILVVAIFCLRNKLPLWKIILRSNPEMLFNVVKFTCYYNVHIANDVGKDKQWSLLMCF